MNDGSVILRLYGDQIDGEVPFDDAGKIIWQFNKVSENVYEILTSKYWIEKEDIRYSEYEMELELDAP